MSTRARLLATAAIAAALVAVPASSVAKPGKNQRCKHMPSVGYEVRGTLVSQSAGTVTLTVTGANSHARNSGEIADQNPSQPGVQVAGATYTVPASDPFVLKLKGFEGADTPSAGDAVNVIGKIPRTKRKCAPAGTSTADRYGTPDVRRVTIRDRDPD